MKVLFLFVGCVNMLNAMNPESNREKNEKLEHITQEENELFSFPYFEEDEKSNNEQNENERILRIEKLLDIKNLNKQDIKKELKEKGKMNNGIYYVYENKEMNFVVKFLNKYQKKNEYNELKKFYEGRIELFKDHGKLIPKVLFDAGYDDAEDPFVLLPAAKGKEVCTITKSVEFQARILARFHVAMLQPDEGDFKSWKTYHHVDGHTGNMFIEEESEQSYLIDTDEILPRTLSDAAKDTRNKTRKKYKIYIEELNKYFKIFFPEKEVNFTEHNL